MKFTVVFPSHESVDLSFGLLFIPSPVWIWGDRQLINLNPEYPGYVYGSANKLINHPNVAGLIDRSKEIVYILVHLTGNGTESDLEMLRHELEQEGFAVHIEYFAFPQ